MHRNSEGPDLVESLGPPTSPSFFDTLTVEEKEASQASEPDSGVCMCVFFKDN